jgi:hypothetical protein
MVVLLHPHSDRFTKLCDGLPVPGPDQLHLQRLDKTFGHRVARGTPHRGQRVLDPPAMARFVKALSKALSLRSSSLSRLLLPDPCRMECSIPSRATSRHFSTVLGCTLKRKATCSTVDLPDRSSTTASVRSSTLLRPGRPRRTPAGSSALLSCAADPATPITSTANPTSALWGGFWGDFGVLVVVRG